MKLKTIKKRLGIGQTSPPKTLLINSLPKQLLSFIAIKLDPEDQEELTVKYPESKNLAIRTSRQEFAIKKARDLWVRKNPSAQTIWLILFVSGTAINIRAVETTIPADFPYLLKILITFGVSGGVVYLLDWIIGSEIVTLYLKHRSQKEGEKLESDLKTSAQGCLTQA